MKFRRLLIFVTVALLSACAPVLEVIEGATQSQAPVLWTAQVSRVERYQGQYQGEQGNATVQDGRVLELELSNRAFGGSDRFGGGLDSLPLRISYSGGGFFEGQVTAAFEDYGLGLKPWTAKVYSYAAKPTSCFSFCC